MHVFSIDPADGGQPQTPLVQANDGNFYGVTATGGGHRCYDADNFCGTVFKVTPTGTESVLHAFVGGTSDGWGPGAPLIQGSDGALYGTTVYGGTNDVGTVFKIGLDGTYGVMYSFGATANDGRNPAAGLIQASDGNFYGTTLGGGPNDCSKSGGNCGTVFRISPTGNYLTLHYFGAFANDGAVPNAGLFEDSDGNFYGTTTSGGDLTCSTLQNIYGCGTVYKMTPTGVITVLHTFGASASDGRGPYGPLIKGPDGAFYGTTFYGGSRTCPSDGVGCGTIFRIASDGNTSNLYIFSKTTNDGTTSYADGYNPNPFLVLAKDGYLYGETVSGGRTDTARTGTIFRVSFSGVKTILYSFGQNGVAPSNPAGGLVQAPDGSFYGVTNYNGTYGATGNRTGQGTIFRMIAP